MAQKSFGWGVTLSAMIPDGATATILTPGFVEGQVDTTNAEVAYDGYLLMADQFMLDWGSDGSAVVVTNMSQRVWEINKGLYVSCPRVPIDASSLEEINATLADHDSELGDHETRIAALETSDAAQALAITDLQARVAALETPVAATASAPKAPPEPEPWVKPPSVATSEKKK